MRALLYLYGLRLKNQFKTFLRSPGKLILTVVFIGLFVLVLWSGRQSQAGMARDPRELSAIVLALYAWLFLLTVSGGLEKGTTFFRMSDVNLVFPAPIRPSNVLMYGLGQQLNTSLMVGFFLLFQYSWLHGLYGVTVGGLVLILLGYGLTIFFAQLTAMAAYSLTSVDAPGREGVKRSRARILLYAGVLLF
ncbi:MAG TPA: putative ABC exporter domain-containing protein, partial [Clostridia bacterium]|nr:putative ABC exporter domain-containing protein [Clostridia bacterium]